MGDPARQIPETSSPQPRELKGLYYHPGGVQPNDFEKLVLETLLEVKQDCDKAAEILKIDAHLIKSIRDDLRTRFTFGMWHDKEENIVFNFVQAMPSLDQMFKAVNLLPPDDYDRRAAALASINSETRWKLAYNLAPALNARIQAMPHETYEQKKELARWVNEQLEPLGLAVKEPKTGLPGKLKAIPGHWPDIGRFAFEVYGDGKRKHPTVSDTLPKLSLIDATPEPEPEKDWRQAVGPKESRRGRTRS